MSYYPHRLMTMPVDELLLGLFRLFEGEGKSESVGFMKCADCPRIVRRAGGKKWCRLCAAERQKAAAREYKRTIRSRSCA